MNTKHWLTAISRGIFLLLLAGCVGSKSISQQDKAIPDAPTAGTTDFSTPVTMDCEFDQNLETKIEASRRHYKVGLIAYSEGNRELAVKEWKKSLSCDPTYVKCQRAIDRAESEQK